ncbi:hypothetical protein HDU93_005105, partial [Gonapodya sp. JEL0774]
MKVMARATPRSNRTRNVAVKDTHLQHPMQNVFIKKVPDTLHTLQTAVMPAEGTRDVGEKNRKIELAKTRVEQIFALRNMKHMR